MDWKTFYDSEPEWSDNYKKTQIRKLVSIGTNSEVIDTLYGQVESVADALLMKALTLGLKLNNVEILELEGFISDGLFKKLVSDNSELFSYEELQDFIDMDFYDTEVKNRVAENKNIDLDEVLLGESYELIVEILKKVALSLTNQAIILENIDFVPLVSVEPLLKRLEKLEKVNVSLIEELEYNSPDRKNVPKNQVKIGLFTLLGLRSLFRKREKEPVRESRKYYDDLTYDQESGTYIEDE